MAIGLGGLAMSDYPEQLDHMFAAWNSADPSDIRKNMKKALSPNIRFVDPSADLVGLDDFEKNVHEVHKKMPGAVYSISSPVDSHHNFHRYHWSIHQNEKLLMTGFDVVETEDSGQVISVIGFFGALPPV